MASNLTNAPFRLTVAGSLAAALSTFVAGCGFGSGVLSQREVVVRFAPGTADQVRKDVLQTCGTLAQVSPEPLPTAERDPATQTGAVRFRVDDADNPELAALLSCLQRFPEVRGYELPQESL